MLSNQKFWSLSEPSHEIKISIARAKYQGQGPRNTSKDFLKTYSLKTDFLWKLEENDPYFL